jgi:nicotinamide-nucleotide amidase
VSVTVPPLKIEILNTGNELMLGFRLNTHQQWLGRRLSDHGYQVSRQVSIPDNGPAIEAAVQESLARADLIITTGGLGPTSDDITRDLIAGLLKRELRMDANTLRRLDEFFAARQRETPERVKVQAQRPEGAIVLQNDHGTAPGLAIEIAPNPFREDGRAAWLIMLPGPPRELYPMFDDLVIPLLKRELPLGHEYICRNLRTTGLGESLVEESLSAALSHLTEDGLEVHYCLSPGGVDVRLACDGPLAEKTVQTADRIAREEIGKIIFGTGDDSLEECVVNSLAETGNTLALAESCTGGLISHRVTNISGASKVLLAGFVAYSNEAKQKSLGVRSETLAEHGAVSEAVAREMAQGARRETGADYAIAVTGIAGPTGGTPEKPIGTVFIGLASPQKTLVMKFLNPFDRETFKQITSQQALEMLRRRILKNAQRQKNPNA